MCLSEEYEQDSCVKSFLFYLFVLKILILSVLSAERRIHERDRECVCFYETNKCDAVFKDQVRSPLYFHFTHMVSFNACTHCTDFFFFFGFLLISACNRNLVDEEAKGKKSTENMNLNDHHTSSSENAAERQLPRFLLPNSTYGQGTTSPASNASPLPNGCTSIAKARRKMIDHQLPADEFTICPPFKRSKSGRGDDDASHRRNSSGSCLDVRSSNGLLADLNVPLICQDSEPLSLSRDTYSHYRRHSADVATSENGWMVLDAG